MAYVKIKSIRTTLNKTLNYAANSKKTEESILVTGLNNCSNNPKLAYKQMLLTKKIKGKVDKILGHHIIQSFEKGEIKDPKIAHEIGIKFAEKLTNNQYEVLVATHIDKGLDGHIHNHIVLNSVNRETGEKFKSDKAKIYELRNLSNELSKEYNLSIIEPKKNSKGMSYKEWLETKNGTSYKAYTKKTIDDLLSKENIKTLDELVIELDKLGIIADYKTVTGDIKKHITFFVKDSSQKRVFRGERIDENYSIEGLRKRIESYLNIDKNEDKIKEQIEKNVLSEEKNILFVEDNINKIIKNDKVKTFDELISKLSKKGITTKYKSMDNKTDLKYVSFIIKNQVVKKNIKGRFYSREFIENRIRYITNFTEKFTAQNVRRNIKYDPIICKYSEDSLKNNLEMTKLAIEEFLKGNTSYYNENYAKKTIKRITKVLEVLDNKNIDSKDEIINDNEKLKEESNKSIKNLNILDDSLNKIQDIESIKEKIKINKELINGYSGLFSSLKNKSKIKELKNENSALEYELEKFDLDLLTKKEQIINFKYKMETNINSCNEKIEENNYLLETILKSEKNTFVYAIDKQIENSNQTDRQKNEKEK